MSVWRAKKDQPWEEHAKDMMALAMGLAMCGLAFGLGWRILHWAWFTVSVSVCGR